MATSAKTLVTIKASINAPIEKVWKKWTSPDDITQWNNASDGWYTPRAENDLTAGGKFSYRMEAKDGSMGFDFRGVYNQVIIHKQIDCTLGDGRKMQVVFSAHGDKTEVVETFETESTNSIELQRNGWQAILDNFKKFAER